MLSVSRRFYQPEASLHLLKQRWDENWPYVVYNYFEDTEGWIFAHNYKVKENTAKSREQHQVMVILLIVLFPFIYCKKNS